MEKIKNKNNNSGKITIERTDNGVIVSDINDDNIVTTKLVYQFYHHDGLINFENMASFFMDLMSTLKFPIEEEETNSVLEIYVDPLDPEQEDLDENDEEDDDN